MRNKSFLAFTTFVGALLSVAFGGVGGNETHHLNLTTTTAIPQGVLDPEELEKKRVTCGKHRNCRSCREQEGCKWCHIEFDGTTLDYTLGQCQWWGDKCDVRLGTLHKLNSILKVVGYMETTAQRGRCSRVDMSPETYERPTCVECDPNKQRGWCSIAILRNNIVQGVGGVCGSGLDEDGRTFQIRCELYSILIALLPWANASVLLNYVGAQGDFSNGCPIYTGFTDHDAGHRGNEALGHVPVTTATTLGLIFAVLR